MHHILYFIPKNATIKDFPVSVTLPEAMGPKGFLFCGWCSPGSSVKHDYVLFTHFLCLCLENSADIASSENLSFPLVKFCNHFLKWRHSYINNKANMFFSIIQSDRFKILFVPSVEIITDNESRIPDRNETLVVLQNNFNSFLFMLTRLKKSRSQKIPSIMILQHFP